jgi:hypothetical protein
MHQEPVKKANYSNFIIFANEKHSAHIPEGDRRYSVCQRQEQPIHLSKGEIAQLVQEIDKVAEFFMCYPYDEDMARTPLENSARKFIQTLSMDSNEEVFSAIMKGNFEFLLDSWPENPPNDVMVHDLTRNDIPTYSQSMIEIYENRKNGHVSRAAIESLLWHLTGVFQPTANKATKWCNHNGLNIKPVQLKERTVRGYTVRHWSINEDHERHMMALLKKEDKLEMLKRMQEDALNDRMVKKEDTEHKPVTH